MESPCSSSGRVASSARCIPCRRRQPPSCRNNQHDKTSRAQPVFPSGRSCFPQSLDRNIIYKGLYALQLIDKLDPVFLGVKAIHQYYYVSTETVLVRAGVMMQHITSTTYVSSISRKFRIGPHSYISRKIADRFLYNAIDVERERGILTASPERVCADLLYINPRAYFDMPKRINWDRVREIQQHLGYPSRAPKHL